MNYSKKNYRKATFFSAILIALICIFALILSLDFADRALNNVRENTVESISSELNLIIGNELNATETNLLSIAHGFTHIDESDCSEYLYSQNEVFNFFSLHYISTSGNVITPGTKAFSFHDSIDHSNTLQNEVKYSNTYYDRVTGDILINMQTAVFKDGVVAGYVFAEYSLTPVLSYISKSVDDVGYAVLSDNNGNDFFSTYPAFTPLHELGDELSESGYLLSDVQDDLTKKIPGTIHLTIDGINRIVTYSSVSFSDWSFALIMEKDKVEADLTMLVSILIAAVTILLLIALTSLLRSWQSKKKVEHAAYYDELTGLPNIQYFKKHIEKVLKDNKDKDFVAVKFDVDDFKAINEMFGFEVGNKVLLAFQKTAQLTEEKTFFIARSGNDEFIMFSGNGLLEDLEKLTPFYEEYFKQIIPELHGYHLTFSYGRYFIDRGETDANEIVTKTSLAHSLAKTDKTKDIWDYDQNYKIQILRHAEISSKMEKALKNDEFAPFLQAKWSLKDDKLVGAEALVRWFESDGKMIFPDTFIPLFETNGFIIELDKYILKNVCKTIRGWLDKGIEAVPVSVNFSRAHFYKESFADGIKKIVDSYNVPHQLIEIELTETTILDNEEQFENVLATLSAENFKISIDDFGAGYSSLGMLKNLKVNTLKLDRSFLLNKEDDSSRGDKVIEGIVKLAHSIGMTIVAEGVEEKGQVEFLRNLGCESAQGYYYAKPISCNEFEEKFFSEK